MAAYTVLAVPIGCIVCHESSEIRINELCLSLDKVGFTVNTMKSMQEWLCNPERLKPVAHLYIMQWWHASTRDAARKETFPQHSSLPRPSIPAVPSPERVCPLEGELRQRENKEGAQGH